LGREGLQTVSHEEKKDFRREREISGKKKSFKINLEFVLSDPRRKKGSKKVRNI